MVGWGIGKIKWRRGRQMKKRYSVIVILMFSYFVMYMDRMVISAVMPYMVKDFSLSSVSMGVVMGAFFLAYAIFSLPGGLMADKLGPRLTMTIGVIWWSIFTFFTGVTKSLTSLLAVRFLFGAGEALFPTSAMKTVSDWFPKKQKGTANSLLLFSNMVGSAIAPLIVGLTVAAWGWRSTFKVLFIPGLILALFIWHFIKNVPSQRKGITKEELAELEMSNVEVETKAAEKASFGTLFKSPILWICVLTTFPFHISTWAIQTWLPTYLVKERHFSPMVMGGNATLLLGLAALGTVTGAFMSDKFFRDNRRVPLVIASLCAGFFLSFAAGASTQMCIVFLCFTFFFGGACGATFWAIPVGVLPSKTMGTSIGIINTFAQFAGFIAPIFMGYMVKVTGNFSLAFKVLVGLFVFSAVLAMFIRQKKDKVDINQNASM
jgi:sugar phosphate permease